MKRITFEGHFCDICQCIGEPGNTSECPGGYCDQRRTWERLKEYEDKIERGELVEVVRCKKCRFYNTDGEYCGFWGACRHPEHYCEEGVPDGERRTDGEKERT